MGHCACLCQRPVKRWVHTGLDIWYNPTLSVTSAPPPPPAVPFPRELYLHLTYHEYSERLLLGHLYVELLEETKALVEMQAPTTVLVCEGKLFLKPPKGI